MMNAKDALPHYKFAEKYDQAHALTYFNKHNSGLGRRLFTWREVGMARKALVLAGRPHSVLDLPCGTGRFWSMLAEEKSRKIFVADNSRAMIDTGLALRPREIVSRIEKSFQCSAFDTALPENFVENVFCMRLLHHISRSEDRIRMLREFARVSSRSVLVSLWVDGNYKAYRLRRRRERQASVDGRKGEHDRNLVSRAEIESEISAAGLDIIGHVDFLKYWEKWRTYVLAVRQGAINSRRTHA
ncbi:MAG TPA: class I SAM-dependent methyltransferase [Kiritimatiellia bacterium]|jgi:SAM-dependent methyltransferase|nr:class I SAM-dependent methyltransferase [Kiritimatiellia bacterium]HRU20004.1 class I SAM-dependent methyltransferase [Kiritimatiellia bacterium]